MNKFQDSPDYLQKRAFFRQLLTIYGRKPVLEALQNPSLSCFKLHLAKSNKAVPLIVELEQLAQTRGIEIQYHDRQALSRISKNGKQDQGVCLDIHCPKHQHYNDFLKQLSNNTAQKNIRLIALDRITNPQNLGMIIRSCCAGNIDGIIISEKGCAKLDGLVTKASTGTLFKAPILHCATLENALDDSQKQGATIVGLSSHAKMALATFEEPQFVIYILGNETEGISKTVEKICKQSVYIPMNNQIESLNVAVTAGLIAFRHIL